jgi:hypothetical protein
MPGISQPQMGSGPQRLTLRMNFLWTLTGNVFYAACQWGILVVLAKLGTSQMVGEFALALAITAPVVIGAGQKLFRKQFESFAVRAQRRSDLSLIASPVARMQNIASYQYSREACAAANAGSRTRLLKPRPHLAGACRRSNRFCFANTAFPILLRQLTPPGW